MPKGMILEHIGMIVKDRDESQEFFTKVMGFKVLRKYETDTQRVAYLYLNDQLLELNEIYSKDRPIGLSHLGFRVEDMKEAMEELEKHGAELIEGPIKFQPKIHATAEVTEEKLLRALKPVKKPYWLISMFKDPNNGITLELLER
ncbi:MAG: VOC family protein [Candidatus Bathyarchaeota archaeon]|nr:VOC family protein [Candidatus Bathyarchaeota archaeon]